MDRLSRRSFLAASSGLLLSTRLAGSPAQGGGKTTALALHGGEKAVKQRPPAGARGAGPHRSPPAAKAA